MYTLRTAVQFTHALFYLKLESIHQALKSGLSKRPGRGGRFESGYEALFKDSLQRVCETCWFILLKMAWYHRRLVLSSAPSVLNYVHFSKLLFEIKLDQLRFEIIDRIDESFDSQVWKTFARCFDNSIIIDEESLSLNGMGPLKKYNLN